MEIVLKFQNNPSDSKNTMFDLLQMLHDLHIFNQITIAMAIKCSICIIAVLEILINIVVVVNHSCKSCLGIYLLNII